MHPEPSAQILPSRPAALEGFVPEASVSDWPDIVARTAPVGRIQLGRIVMLAAETGARFERDGIVHDPAAWMVAPRRLFGGSSAVEACLEEGPFLRGMVFHGLSAGLDADPELIDTLISDDAEVDAGGVAEAGAPSADWPRMDLYTATAVCERSNSTSHVFHACMAFGAEDVFAELSKRLGAEAARQASVRRGFDPSHPIAVENVSPALGAVLIAVSEDAHSPLGHGLNILIEHRFQH